MITITTTREFEFTLEEYRAYMRKPCTRKHMEERLRDDNGQFAHLMSDCFAPVPDGWITAQTFTIERKEVEP